MDEWNEVPTPPTLASHVVELQCQIKSLQSCLRQLLELLINETTDSVLTPQEQLLVYRRLLAQVTQSEWGLNSSQS